ncbi:hypothetical protein PMZ80_009133 [Knufia obscura]|uniref:gamma-glutamylcyclotransferase n=2 Tax=Knufia TaxID=430999 RepID=A0AAN8FB10_9EURO|nr:hypothetical protein PMZ80_009133 [Knufia obscura]KAK5954911.1 hypothetical protein OHC33_003590 [Knufia fluminis]
MAKEQDVKQVALPADMTSSKTGTFYFAFGSNLSPSQMSLRLNASPDSSKPAAIARLDAHAWIICQRGYANVVALPANNKASHENTVWGLVYDLSAEDEARLDMFEGHDTTRNPSPELNPDPSRQQEVPYLQGSWDYNKHYLPMTVTKWLKDPNQYGVGVPGWSEGDNQQISIRGLVYVDELRTQPGKINQEYIGRMNRAIRESVELGIPQTWVDAVMRQYIPAGIEVDHEGYVGTDKGYVEAEGTETASDLKERVVREMQQAQS